MSDTKHSSITVEDIEDILDEIEENEKKFSSKAITEKRAKSIVNNNVDWDEILIEMKKGNISFIKSLITANDIDINAQNPKDGRTLLIYATIIGNIDLIKIIYNFGASVQIVDNEGMDALKYAIKYGQKCCTINSYQVD
eukprot:241803_1